MRLPSAEQDFGAQLNRELLPLYQGIATSVSGNCIGMDHLPNGPYAGGLSRRTHKQEQTGVSRRLPRCSRGSRSFRVPAKPPMLRRISSGPSSNMRISATQFRGYDVTCLPARQKQQTAPLPETVQTIASGIGFIWPPKPQVFRSMV